MLTHSAATSDVAIAVAFDGAATNAANATAQDTASEAAVVWVCR